MAYWISLDSLSADSEGYLGAKPKEIIPPGLRDEIEDKYGESVKFPDMKPDPIDVSDLDTNTSEGKEALKQIIVTQLKQANASGAFFILKHTNIEEAGEL